MSFLRSMAIGLVLSAVGAGSAQADLIGVTNFGNYFSDAGTGLNWLDVTASVDRSYNDVSTQFGTGGDFEGWSYATAAQFGAMLSSTTNGAHSGITGVSQFEAEAEGDTHIRELVGLFGDTLDAFYQATYGKSLCAQFPGQCPSGDLLQTVGLISDSFSSHSRVLTSLVDDDRTTTGGDYIYVGQALPNTDKGANIGSYLVRNTLTITVPEPTSIALMGLGLVGLGFARRRKTKGLTA